MGCASRRKSWRGDAGNEGKTVCYAGTNGVQRVHGVVLYSTESLIESSRPVDEMEKLSNLFIFHLPSSIFYLPSPSLPSFPLPYPSLHHHSHLYRTTHETHLSKGTANNRITPVPSPSLETHPPLSSHILNSTHQPLVPHLKHCNRNKTSPNKSYPLIEVCAREMPYRDIAASPAMFCLSALD